MQGQQAGGGVWGPEEAGGRPQGEAADHGAGYSEEGQNAGGAGGGE